MISSNIDRNSTKINVCRTIFEQQCRHLQSITNDIYVVSVFVVFSYVTEDDDIVVETRLFCVLFIKFIWKKKLN